MTDKEQIIIDGVTYYKQQDINEGLDEEHYITEFHLLATHYNLLLEDYARKTQECEKLEDFRTLTRGVFTFGDSDVDDENFIKYLQEYSRSYEEAIDGYYRLTDITGINYTVHGGADIEEIIKRVDILKQECEELKVYAQRQENQREAYYKEFLRKDKALEEIEEYIKEEEWSLLDYVIRDINDIINKAKGESNG